MQIKFHHPALLSAALIASTAYGSEDYFWISGDSGSYSSIAPIKQLLNDLEGPQLDSGTYAYAHSQIELGERRKNFELYLFSRMDDYYAFTQDTANYLYSDNNDLDFPDKTYDINLEVNRFRANGIGAGYYFDLSEKASLRIAANYLYASKMTDGTISGQVTTQNQNLSGSLNLDYAYSDDSIFDRSPADVKGHGLSLDLDLGIEVNERYSVSISARDLFSRIYWKDQTTTQAQTTYTLYDLGDGSALARPGIRGIEGNSNFYQRLPSRITLVNKLSISDSLSLNAIGFWYDDNFQPIIGTEHRLADKAYSFSYDLETSALSIGVEYGDLSLKLGSDNISPNSAQTYVLRGKYIFR